MGDATLERPQVSIRDMREEDIGSVLDIDRRITGSRRAITYAAVPSSYVGGELEASMVAEASGRIVGFLLGRITDSPRGLADSAWVQLIGVDPSYQRQGVGTRLVQAFMARCREKGARSVHIMVSWHDWWMLSFLRSVGFARGEMAEFIKPIEGV